jgi:hypothetical protein
MIDRKSKKEKPLKPMEKLPIQVVPTFKGKASDLEKFAAEYGIQLEVALQHPEGFSVRASYDGVQTDSFRQRAEQLKTAKSCRDARFFVLAAVFLEWMEPGYYTFEIDNGVRAA